ncbi:MAG TPA: hypothetical protein VK629_05700 [Steroidobacteraceae bacterium]|nr:hypothetical protein [Steroidobacteraceae bacterium]
MPDFTFQNHGSICILVPVSEAAQAWRDAHLPAEGEDCQEWGGGVVIEPRYVADILDGITNDGLSVE